MVTLLRRVLKRVSDSEVEVRCDKQGVVTDPSGVGRRRVVADFTSPDSLSLGGAAKKRSTLFAPVVSPLIVHVADHGGDSDAPVDLVIDDYRNAEGVEGGVSGGGFAPPLPTRGSGGASPHSRSNLANYSLNYVNTHDETSASFQVTHTVQ